MRPYSEAVKVDVRMRMGPRHRQSVTEIPQELGIHVITFSKWRKVWRLQGEVVPATQKDSEGWGHLCQECPALNPFRLEVKFPQLFREEAVQRCNEVRSGINATSGCLATLVVAPAHEMG
jgi:hypothetical protein